MALPSKSTSCQELYEQLLKQAAYIKGLDKGLLQETYAFAVAAHAGQKRVSGEDFMIHPLKTALTLTRLKVDQETLLAALLHDVVEDSELNLSELENKFGPGVARLVDGVTKLSKMQYVASLEERQVESLRKMFLVMAKDLRVILIKLADRLHNMNTLEFLAPEKRSRKALETLEIYAPLADRLGLGQIKWQLEDEAFRYLYPLQYQKLARTLAATHRDREQYIDNIKQIIEREARKSKINTQVNGRTKNLYSIYKKMQTKQKGLEEIYDIFALRVVVSSVADCYAVLGVIHDLWRPKPGRFKDYIAVPKANGYQSLHTTVFGPNGTLTEIQIRTEQMHEEAEFGVPSHWYYKEKGHKTTGKTPPAQMEWVNKIIELQENLKGGDEFLHGLKIDIFQDRIFVFTPQGDVKDLPVGATCVDFAYSVHTELGHRMKGCKLNGVMVPINTVLKTGDLIDIISNKAQSGPKRDWLKFAITSHAKSKIKAWFKEQAAGHNIEIGGDLLNKKLEQIKSGLQFKNISKSKMQQALSALQYPDLEAALAAIGEGVLTTSQLVRQIFDRSELLGTEEFPVLQAKRVKKLPQASLRVIVAGEENLLTRLANCCQPLPGEPIIGYVTRGKGVSIHRVDCSGIKRFDRDRLLTASWRAQNAVAKLNRVSIRVSGDDRLGVFRDVVDVVSTEKVNIEKAQANTDKLHPRKFTCDLLLDVNNFEQLEETIEKLEQVPGVKKVKRI